MNIIEFAKQSVGIPFLENGRNVQEGWDCWGLCVAAYKTLGIDLSRYEQVHTMDIEAGVKEIERQINQWVPIPLGQERAWDVIHLRPAHLGLVIEKGRMLHVMAGAETCVCWYNSPIWYPKVLGIYRHEQFS